MTGYLWNHVVEEPDRRVMMTSGVPSNDSEAKGLHIIQEMTMDQLECGLGGPCDMEQR